MRWALHLFLAMAVLLCGLHIGEGEPAREAFEHHQAAWDDGAADQDGDASPEKPAKAADAGHNHCPIALDQQRAAIPCTDLPGTILVARRVTALRSLAQAPPVEPPLA